MFHVFAFLLPKGQKKTSMPFSGPKNKLFSSREPETGVIDSIFISQANLEIREKRKYHSGWLKEQR